MLRSKYENCTKCNDFCEIDGEKKKFKNHSIDLRLFLIENLILPTEFDWESVFSLMTKIISYKQEVVNLKLRQKNLLWLLNNKVIVGEDKLHYVKIIIIIIK